MTGELDDALLGRYLLDGCSEDEKARVEERLFVDDEVFERLRQLEEDLIDRHLAGRLAGDERERFETAYAAPARRQRVMFSRALKEVLSGADGSDAARRSGASETGLRASWLTWLQESFAIRLAFAAAALVLVAGTVLATWQATRLRSSLASVQADNNTLRQQLEAERQRLGETDKRAAALSDALSRERASRESAGAAQPPRLPLALFVLSPGLLRSARAPALVTVPAATETVRLQLDLEAGLDAGRFRAELRNGDARVLWSQDRLGATRIDAGAAVRLTLPVAALQKGDYEVVLFSATDGRQSEEVARYYFTLVRP
jgi:hypothetical protein